MLKHKDTSFDPSDTLRVTEIGHVAGRAFRTHLNKVEFVIRLPGLLDLNNDKNSQPINVQTCRNLLYKGFKSCLAIRTQQKVLQMTSADKIQAARLQCVAQSMGIKKGCDEQCTNCTKGHLLKQFVDLALQSNSASRPEPFAQIASGQLEKLLLAYQRNPWLLLANPDFSNCMFRTMVETMKIGIRVHMTGNSNFGFGALNRLEEIYRMVTTGKAKI